MAAVRSPTITRDCKLLVESITNFKETEENFKTCLDFALSNLLYHSYASVNSHQVREKISRLHDKFLIHSDLGKAKAFLRITERLISVFDQRKGSQKESGYALLSLILTLSTSRSFSCTDVIPSQDVEGNSIYKEESLHFDWTNYLREDDIQCSWLSDSDSETSLSEKVTSDHSLTSEDDSVEDLTDAFLRPPRRDDSGLGISPDSCSGASQQLHAGTVPQECISVVQKSERNASSFYPYWNSSCQRTYGTCPYNMKTMNFTKMWDDYMTNQNLFTLIEKKVIVHERNVIKEVLWMLCGVKDLFIAHWNGTRFIPNRQIHLTNLTSNTLGTVLDELCEVATESAALYDTLHSILQDPAEVCCTYRAYAQSILEQLQKVRDSVSVLDIRLRKGNELFTLLVLRNELRPLLQDLNVLHHIHAEIISATRGDQGPCNRACRVLHTLWRLLYEQSLQEQTSSSLGILLRIYLKTIKPFFRFLEELMILGSFKDTHQEFLVMRNNVKCTDESFWECGYSFRALPADLEQDFFLRPFLQDILSAGKSLEVLNTIHSGTRHDPFRLDAARGDLYAKFLSVLNCLIGQRSSSKSSEIIDKDNSANEDIHSSQDPLLQQSIFPFQSCTAKFFRPDVNPVYKRVVPKVPEEFYSEQYKNIDRILESLEPRSLKPLSVSLTRALATCLEFAYSPVCRRLLVSLKEEHHIMRHLDVMRKYFLMESGDLMFSFYSEVFQRIFHQQPWLDISFLYSALQNAIAEDKENSERLCIFMDLENSEVNHHHPLTHLNALQLSYEVEWPVSILLGPTVQQQYSQIFSFLLQIRCAKYLLDHLYSTGLCRWRLHSKLQKNLSKSKFPREQKIHGLYILRMRLMFFVNGLHNYIMTRILHSFGLEFVSVLEAARTVEEMVSAHHHYLKSVQERCLLDRRISYLKEHLFRVLELCHTFQQLWLKGVDHISLDQLQDIESQFSKYSNFFQYCFNTPVRRETYLHLDNLTNTMLSDTHAFHIFANKE